MSKPEHQWRTPDGQVIACVEKLKVIGQNLDELRDMCRDALEDAVLMGCDEAQFRQALHDLIDQVDCEFAPQSSDE